MKTLTKLFFLLLITFTIPVFSQSSDTKAEKKSDVMSARVKRKKDKAEWKAKRKSERSERKSIRSHDKRLQTKETRKRMRKDRHKAALVNQNKREFFLIRWFRPKPRTGKW